ncbi:phosphinothricin acetyltransferase [Pseudomonas sp. BIGb0408]|uniref:Phosphinothricin acetyltransferase n=1 Tax=Phytopseudomonas flavescens TaxID=29435 RepID=A0A7Y9XLL0_9GAMM|nr:phosphinothricin acetyltransferase [Pseudomonas sp. BIGb0408]NYH73623.1 phosphinothricin acetyltransferase [Pseudomonas flavescens]
MINVREASDSDAEAIQAICEPVVLVTAISFEEVPLQ